MNVEPTVPIFQNAPPPQRDGQRGYDFYPASAFATMRIDALQSSTSKTPKFYWQWANHGARPRHKANIIPNGYGPQKLLANFSNRDLANACTIAQTAAALGQPYNLAVGLTPEQLTPSLEGERMDVCIIPPTVAPYVEGVVLDYEVFDGRTAEETAAFLVRYAALVKQAGKSAILFTNALDAPSQNRTAVTEANLPAISAAFDYVTIFLWSRNRQGSIPASFERQKDMLGPASAQKGLLVMELAGTSMDDARFIRQVAASKQVRAVMFWRNYARQGGSCSTETNRKIGCVALGQCG